MTGRLFAVILTFSLLLAACGTIPPATTPAAPLAVETATATFTKTVIPTVRLTRMPTSIQTLIKPRLTVTPIPTNTLSATEIAWPTIHALTQQAFVTQFETTYQTSISLATAFPANCDEVTYPQTRLLSPDGEWLATSCHLTNNHLAVSNRSETRSFTLRAEDFTDEGNPINLGFMPIHWTKDSRFLFFEVDNCCWDPFIEIFSTTSNLYRLDISNGIVSKYVDGNGRAFDFSFSPTDRRLVKVPLLVSPVILYVYDLLTGAETAIDLEISPVYRQAGDTVWSPDGLKIMLVAAYGWGYGDDVPGEYFNTLIAIDLNNLSQKIIVNEFEGIITPIHWTEDDVLIYTTTTYSDYANNRIPIINNHSYDLKTNQLITATPTP